MLFSANKAIKAGVLNAAESILAYATHTILHTDLTKEIESEEKKDNLEDFFHDLDAGPSRNVGL